MNDEHTLAARRERRTELIDMYNRAIGAACSAGLIDSDPTPQFAVLQDRDGAPLEVGDWVRFPLGLSGDGIHVAEDFVDQIGGRTEWGSITTTAGLVTWPGLVVRTDDPREPRPSTPGWGPEEDIADDVYGNLHAVIERLCTISGPVHRWVQSGDAPITPADLRRLHVATELIRSVGLRIRPDSETMRSGTGQDHAELLLELAGVLLAALDTGRLDVTVCRDGWGEVHTHADPLGEEPPERLATAPGFPPGWEHDHPTVRYRAASEPNPDMPHVIRAPREIIDRIRYVPLEGGDPGALVVPDENDEGGARRVIDEETRARVRRGFGLTDDLEAEEMLDTVTISWSVPLEDVDPDLLQVLDPQAEPSTGRQLRRIVRRALWKLGNR